LDNSPFLTKKRKRTRKKIYPKTPLFSPFTTTKLFLLQFSFKNSYSLIKLSKTKNFKEKSNKKHCKKDIKTTFKKLGKR